uniref:Uncharacterized protein LOC114344282 n=1 Tax=Diabrotica virgifera virgifera TaxID=50390 RepID=A0A6P7GMQ6_DIAVI
QIKEIDTSEDFVVLSAGFGSMVIVGQMTYLYKDWEQLLDSLLDFSNYGKPEEYNEFVKWSNRWVKYYIFVLLPTALLVYLTFECVEILRMHFINLSSHFRAIISDKNIRSRPDGLGYWVKYHNHIIRMGSKLSYLAKRTISFVTLVSAFVIACSENQLLHVSFVLFLSTSPNFIQ